MTCEGCVKDISNSLRELEGIPDPSSTPQLPSSRLTCNCPETGIKKVEASLKDQLVFIEGTAPPSSIVSAIQSTGRDAILRGSGSTNSTFGMK